MAAPSTHSKNALRVDLRVQGKCAFLYLHGRLDNQFERIVLRAIERKDLYVLTHPEQREILRRRHARIDAMFDPERW